MKRVNSVVACAFVSLALAACASEAGDAPGEDQGEANLAVSTKQCSPCAADAYAQAKVSVAASVCSGGVQYTCTTLPTTGSYTACGAGPTFTCATGAVVSASSVTQSTSICLDQKSYTCTFVTSATTSQKVCGGADASVCPEGMYESSSSPADASCSQHSGRSRQCTRPGATATSITPVCGTICPKNWFVDVGSDKNSPSCRLEGGASMSCLKAQDLDSIVCAASTTATAVDCPAGTYKFASRSSYVGCGGRKAAFCRPLPAADNASTSGPVLQDVCGSTCPPNFYSSSSTTSPSICGIEKSKQTCTPFKKPRPEFVPPFAGSSNVTACGTVCPVDAAGNKSFPTNATFNDQCDTQGNIARACARPPVTAVPNSTTFKVCASAGCPAGWFIAQSNDADSSCEYDGWNTSTCKLLPTASPSRITVCGGTCPAGWAKSATPASITDAGNCANQGFKAVICTK